MMAKLERRAVQAGYREIRAAVGLYDWLALRFWITLTYGPHYQIGNPLFLIPGNPFRTTGQSAPEP